MRRDDKPVGRSGSDILPDYRHAPVSTVRLAYPFVLFGRRIEAIRLSPPTYGALAEIRGNAHVGPVDIIVALSGELAAVISSMRWPDVEAVLAEGIKLLPPELASALAGDGAAGAESAAGSRQSDKTKRPTPPDAEPDAGDQFGANVPEDFVRSV